MTRKNPLKEKIETILFKYPHTRDDDVDLMLYLWRDFYPARMNKTEANEEYPNGRAFVYVSDIKVMPREDHIKRIRARIQNVERKFLPTKIEVVKARKQNEERWRNEMRFN